MEASGRCRNLFCNVTPFVGRPELGKVYQSYQVFFFLIFLHPLFLDSLNISQDEKDNQFFELWSSLLRGEVRSLCNRTPPVSLLQQADKTSRNLGQAHDWIFQNLSLDGAVRES